MKCLICPQRRVWATDMPMTYFSFPSSLEVRQKWLSFCKITGNQYKSDLFLCYKHFGYEDFIDERHKGQNIRLRLNAVPSLYPPTIPPLIDSNQPRILRAETTARAVGCVNLSKTILIQQKLKISEQKAKKKLLMKQIVNLEKIVRSLAEEAPLNQ